MKGVLRQETAALLLLMKIWRELAIDLMNSALSKKLDEQCGAEPYEERSGECSSSSDIAETRSEATNKEQRFALRAEPRGAKRRIIRSLLSDQTRSGAKRRVAKS